MGVSSSSAVRQAIACEDKPMHKAHAMSSGASESGCTVSRKDRFAKTAAATAKTIAAFPEIPFRPESPTYFTNAALDDVCSSDCEVKKGVPQEHLVGSGHGSNERRS